MKNIKMIYSNFNRKNRFLGIIDYKSLVIFLIYVLLIYVFLEKMSINLEFKIYIFLFLVIPVFALFFINLNNESVIDTIIIMIIFLFNKKIYIDKDIKVDRYLTKFK